MRIQLIVASILMASLSSLAQKENKHIRKGNELYLQKKYDEAEVEYRKALEKNNKATNAQYNLSNALYKQKRYKEASTILDELATKTKDPQELSRLYHNLGNAMLEDKDYQNSIEAYKKSLKHNPNAEDTRYNLSYAMKKMQRQEQEQQKQKQKQNQPNDPNPKKDPNKDQKTNNQKQEQQKQQLNRDEAEQMLDALNRNEKELRKKTDKQKGKDGVPASGKEW